MILDFDCYTSTSGFLSLLVKLPLDTYQNIDLWRIIYLIALFSSFLPRLYLALDDLYRPCIKMRLQKRLDFACLDLDFSYLCQGTRDSNVVSLKIRAECLESRG